MSSKNKETGCAVITEETPIEHMHLGAWTMAVPSALRDRTLGSLPMDPNGSGLPGESKGWVGFKTYTKKN